MQRNRPEPNVNLTYVDPNGTAGSAGDKYVGLDQFGRVADQRWQDAVTYVTKDRRQSGYDRDSNRTYAENLADAGHSEVYAYDGLNQLTSFQRGTLNAGKTGLTGAASRSLSP